MLQENLYEYIKQICSQIEKNKIINQETKTLIQIETEYYFFKNGLYIDPMLLVYPLITEKYSYHHYKQELNNHIKHLIRYGILIDALSNIKYYY
mgnify:FL=1